MPPGTEAPTPPPRKPTTRRVRPGMITNKGQPYCVRSTPNRTTPRANRPTTTRTTPSAALDPPPRAREGCDAYVTGGGGGGGEASGASTGADAAGGAAEGSMLPAGVSIMSDGFLSGTGSLTTFEESSVHLGAKMSGLPASTSELTCAMSSLTAASAAGVDSPSVAGWSAPVEVLPRLARLRLLMTPQLNPPRDPQLSLSERPCRALPQLTILNIGLTGPCPRPTSSERSIAPVMNSFPSCTAARGALPLARPAGIAPEKTQPLPWVFVVLIRGD